MESMALTTTKYFHCLRPLISTEYTVCISHQRRWSRIAGIRHVQTLAKKGGQCTTERIQSIISGYNAPQTHKPYPPSRQHMDKPGLIPGPHSRRLVHKPRDLAATSCIPYPHY